jgi:hypothetical protein
MNVRRGVGGGGHSCSWEGGGVEGELLELGSVSLRLVVQSVHI